MAATRRVDIRAQARRGDDDECAELARSVGAMKNVYLSLEPLQELRSKLVDDLNLVDEIAARRIEFTQTQLTDMNNAREMVPSIVANIEEIRRVMKPSRGLRTPTRSTSALVKP
jgi:hypothetical protein